jgi:uncharacterized membrane protein YkvA (DUF1232 family)
LAARDPRVPVVAKLVIVFVVAYALSPIDLIPDFIPVLGYLDDMLFLPMGIALAIKLMPRDVWEDCKNQARAELASELPRNRTGAIVIATVWLALLGLVAELGSNWGLELSKSTRSPRSTGSTAGIKTSLIPQSVAGSDKGRCLTSRWPAIGGRDPAPGFYFLTLLPQL